jgi:hypothetical protein
VTRTFIYTGAEQTFTVPGGVNSVGVVAIGGYGGAATDSTGGAPAKVVGNISVTAGQTLYVEVGGVGKSLAEGGAGGFNGGSAGAGGGGGASDVRTSPGLSPDHRLIAAAGGGGGGGSGPSGTGANGGAANEPGASSEQYSGGGAGTSLEGGQGAEGCLGTKGVDGAVGQGGAGGDAGSVSDPGGGGGGGYYGGGGGGGACEIGSSGGGGGSSLIPPLGLQSIAFGAEPVIEISYVPVPPSISIVSPAEGATYTQGQAVTAIYSCSPPEGTGVKTCAGPVSNGGALDTATHGPHAFTVEAEDTDGTMGVKEVSYTVVAPKKEESKSQPQPPVVPDTILGGHPKSKVVTTKKKIKVKFTFSSDVTGATFQCKLDNGSFAPCTSPKTYKVKPGKHKFSAEAVSPGGTDSTPATFSFKVKKTA